METQEINHAEMKAEEQPVLLYVDDELENLTGFKFVFRKHYKIFVAQSAFEGLEIMRNNEIHLVITDQRMPKMTGIEFLEKIASSYPDVTRIILTGFSDVEAIIQAINKGRVYRYITKPWNKDELKVTIENAMEAYKLRKENKILVENLRGLNEQLESYAQNLENKVKVRTEQIVKQKEEIELINNNLEDVVKERTAKLSDTLHQLAETNKELDLFLYRSSHDLRSPLTSLMGLVGLGGMTLKEPESHEIMAKMNHIVTRMDKMLYRLQMVSYINTTEDTDEPIDFKKILHQIQTEYAELIKANGVDYKVHVQENIKYQAKPLLIKLILQNLIENAILFHGNHSPYAYIDVTQETDGWVTIEVKDNGTGIEERFANNIFDMYFRANENSQGNGLGLYVVKKAVEKLKGEINFETTWGKFTVFVIKLK